MNLEDETGLEALGPEPLVHPDHGDLHHIGGRTLDGHIQGHPFTEGAEVKVGGLEFRQPAAAAHEGGHIAVLLALLLDVVHIFPDAGKGGQVAFHVLPCLLLGDTDVLGQGETGDAVDDAEVDRLGPTAELGTNFLHRNTKNLGGRPGVDILPGQEALDHLLVLGHVGQEAQFDLGVVGVHQHMAFGGHEHFTNLGTQFGADGDVLEVGFRGGQAAGGGDSVLEAGVDAAIVGDDLGQALHIGGVQLGQLAVLQNLLNDGVGHPQLFQDLSAGGVARLGLLHRGQAQLFKEDHAQLLGGVQVEFLPGQPPDLLLEGGNAGFQHLAELVQGFVIHQHTGHFHPGQDSTQGHLHLVIDSHQLQLLEFFW